MDKYCSLSNHLNASVEKVEFDVWELENSLLADGITRLTHHMGVHGLLNTRELVSMMPI